MYVVTVDFDILPEHREAFIKAVSANADRSLTDEPGCRQFDVCVGGEQASQVFLYELYDDAAAFKVHLASTHFAEFNAATAPWVAAKTVRLFDRVYPVLS